MPPEQEKQIKNSNNENKIPEVLQFSSNSSWPNKKNKLVWFFLFVIVVAILSYLYITKSQTPVNKIINQSTNLASTTNPSTDITANLVAQQRKELLAKSQIVIPEIVSQTVISQKDIPADLNIFLLSQMLQVSLNKVKYKDNTAGYSFSYNSAVSVDKAIKNFLSNYNATYNPKTRTNQGEWNIKIGWIKSTFALIDLENAKYLVHLTFDFVTDSQTKLTAGIIFIKTPNSI
jgi:hypothetical protein